MRIGEVGGEGGWEQAGNKSPGSLHRTVCGSGNTPRLGHFSQLWRHYIRVIQMLFFDKRRLVLPLLPLVPALRSPIT